MFPRRWQWVLAIVVVASLLAVGGVGASHGDAANRTVHEHPDEIDAEGNVADVADWLAVALGDRLGESAIQLSASEYELARELLGENYDGRLADYVDIAGETGRESDEAAVDTFEETQAAQRAYAETLAETAETRRAYEEAIAAGDEALARERFRELETLAAEVDARAEHLVELYERLEALTRVDLEDARSAISAERQEVLTSISALDELEFVNTRVVVMSATSTASYVDPLEIAGRVETVDGEPVDVGRVALGVGERTRSVAVGSDGTFSLSFHPVVTPVDVANASVRFEPPARSPYRAASTSVPLSIEPVEPTIVLDTTTTTARYGAPVAASGTVTVEGEPVAGVPLVLSVGDQALASGETGPDGAFTLDGPLGPRPAAGDRTLAVEIPLADRAIVGVDTARSIAVTETPTTLSLAVRDNASDIVVGQLSTRDGAAVPGQSIQLTVDGAAAGTTQTDAAGAFTRSVSPEPGESVDVGASYDAPGTNLGPSSDEMTVTGGNASGTGDGSPADTDGVSDDGVSPNDGASLVERLVAGIVASISGTAGLTGVGALAALAALVVLGAGGWLLASRWSWDLPSLVPFPRPEAAQPGERGDTPGVTPSGDEDVLDDQPEAWLERAEAYRAEGAEGAAVSLAYRVARAAISGDVARGATHWEFLAWCRDHGVTPLDPVERLTRMYDRVTFAADGSARGDVGPAIEAAREVVEATRSDGRSAD